MTKKRKSLGFSELQWICPFCEGVNRGTVRVCGNCSAPQPADVAFVQPAQEKLIVEQAQVEKIRAKSAEIHCAYCGTRNNPANTTCTRCLANLSEGTARETGKTLGAHRKKAVPDVTCPSCGTPNAGTAAKCKNCLTSLHASLGIAADPVATPVQQQGGGGSKFIVFAVIGFVLLACISFFVLSQRTTEVVGTVQAVEWQRSIPILALGPVEYDTWRDRVPSGGEVLQCEDRVREKRGQPDSNRLSLEVCGEPYTVDQGNGFGEVVQDCEYEIYDDWCEYVVDEWRQVDVVTARGDTFTAYWPETPISAEYQSGDPSEQYQVQFRTDGQTYTYETNNYNQFTSIESTDSWVLDINTFGSILSVEPMR